MKLQWIAGRLADIYRDHGWKAFLITAAIGAIVIAGICLAAGIDLGDAVRWLEAR
jgi:hypothetical protein